MKTVFTIEMLPAREGDCLWIEYGDAEHPCRILIDGGRGDTDQQILQRIKQVKDAPVHFEIIVVTHVDQDHIDGILHLLERKDAPLTYDDIWFNGWRHLDDTNREAFGPIDGEKLTYILLARSMPWNKTFDLGPVVAGDDPEAVVLPGGMKLTLISPTRQKLADLKRKWVAACRKAGLDPSKPPKPIPYPGFERFGRINIEELANTPFKGDSSEANGSSIAFIAEFEGRRALFGGDAHPDVLIAGIRNTKYHDTVGEKIRLDAFKISHHGSRANTSRELLEMVDCPRWLFSTNSDRFKHPDPESVAKVIKFGGSHPELIFNYCSDQTTLWNNTSWKERYGYRVRFVEPKDRDRKINLLQT